MGRWLASLIAIAALTEGCSPAQTPFRTVQICVADQQGVAKLKGLMREAAASERLQFIDNSVHQGNALKHIGADKLLKRDASLALDVHIEGNSGMGVTAGNLGLPPYQVALGFTEGADAAKAHRLSARLIQALSKNWHVETIPVDKGAIPMKSCGG
jgi:hypothetical protein